MGTSLSGAEDPVPFDINGDGSRDLISWTARGARVGFLCVDLNQNGRIDSGRELFGTSTLWPISHLPTPNGFEALKLYDSPSTGGNGNGKIDPGDWWFTSLRVWIDRNHNGEAEPSELLTLQEAGIQEISLTYRDSRRRDRHGNLFRYRGSAILRDAHGHVREQSIFDVFFVPAR